MTDDEKLIVSIDEAEAMIRFIEGFAGIVRAPGLDARDYLDALGHDMPAADLRAIRAGVRRVLTYLHEQVAAAASVGNVTVDRIPGAQVPRRRQ